MINNTYTYLLICLAVLLTSCNDDVAKPNPIITPNTTDECAVYTWQYLNNDLTLDTIYVRYGRLDSIYIDKDSFYVSPFVVNPMISVESMLDSNGVVQPDYDVLVSANCGHKVDTVYVNYGENRINDFLYKENTPIDTAKLISFFDTIPIALGYGTSSSYLEVIGYSLKAKGLPDDINISSFIPDLCGSYAENIGGGGGYNSFLSEQASICRPTVSIEKTYPPMGKTSINNLNSYSPSSIPTGIVKWELILVNRYGEEFILNMESVFVEVEGVPADPEIPPTLYH